MPFSALPLHHAGLVSLGKRSHSSCLAVGKSSCTIQQPPCPPPWFTGHLWWGWQSCLRPGRGVRGRHSSITICQCKGRPWLIFSPAPLLSYSQLRKDGENAFGHWLMYVFSLTVQFFQYNRSPNSPALKMPLKSFCQSFD